MDPRFDKLASDPWAQVFQVVFFPDRIYHAQYLNATRCSRYRYNVWEVRGKADIMVLKGEVYLDGTKISNFLRIEYRASRLVEVLRESNRFLGPSLVADLRASLGNEKGSAQARVSLDFCPWINAYQVELWETLEPPAGRRHDYQVLTMMGHQGAITTIPAFNTVLTDGAFEDLRWVNVSFEESPVYAPLGRTVPAGERAIDNYYKRNIQIPKSDFPSDSQNTRYEENYGVDFARGWYFEDVSTIKPVKYRNAMMDDDNPDVRPGDVNVVQMRWILQQEFGGANVFFHEVTVPEGVVEGTHRHIGSEELYYIVEGTGLAWLGENDDPKLTGIPLVERHIYGFGLRLCREVPVRPGSVIFTKSGGIHGIANTGQGDLKFVAFLYHSA
jgi:mannose-6-phosphate isomerase-like protein (cupin superfamily)